MNWPWIVSAVEQLLLISALAGALASAVTFVVNGRKVYEDRRANAARAWQKASIHEMLHRSERFLTTQEITQQLRSASFENSIAVKKSEFTVGEVRLLLLEMLNDNAISQLWGDQYGITRRDPQVEKAIIELQNDERVRNLYDLISLAPHCLTSQDLIDRIGETGRLRESDLVLIIGDLLSKGFVAVDDGGRWYVPSTERVKDARAVENRRVEHLSHPTQVASGN